MDWSSIIGAIVGLLAVIGLPLALRARKKGGPQNVEQFFNHLQEMGIRASRLEKGVTEERVGTRRASGQKAEGVIKITGRNIDYINVVSVTSQYGTQYFLDYLVRSPNWSGQKKGKKTRLVKKKGSTFRGRIVDVEWKGDAYLARELNLDYQLKDRLLLTELDKLGGIWIFPEPKYEYTRVRIPYRLPSIDLFEAIDSIAKHIKSGW